jgi:hypothetical protein
LTAGTPEVALKAVQQVARIAAEAAGVFVSTEYDVDALQAVPVEHFAASQFTEMQWPQTVAKVESLRDRKTRAKRNKLR